MRWFAIGLLAVYGPLGCAFVLWQNALGAGAGPFLRAFSQRDEPLWALPPTVVVPVSASIGAAWFVCLLRSPRLFDVRLRRRGACVWTGVVCGMLGTVVAIAGLVLLPEVNLESATIGISAAAMTTLTLLCGRRQRAGCCHQCGYDFAGVSLMSRGICTECGTPITPAT